MSRPKIIISDSDPILPGSLATVYARCGRKNCRCYADPTKAHGPYYRWTGLIEGKPTSVALSVDMLKECKKRMVNYKKLTAEFEKAVTRALKNPPWGK